MCPRLVEIRSVTSGIMCHKQEEERKMKKTAVKYKPFGIAMPCGLNTTYSCDPMDL